MSFPTRLIKEIQDSWITDVYFLLVQDPAINLPIKSVRRTLNRLWTTNVVVPLTKEGFILLLENNIINENYRV